MDAELTIQIEPPIESAGGKYDELRLREPLIGQWAKAETHRGATAQFIALISAVSGWPAPAVHLLPVSKFNEAVDYLAGFLGSGRATGETSA